MCVAPMDHAMAPTTSIGNRCEIKRVLKEGDKIREEPPRIYLRRDNVLAATFLPRRVVYHLVYNVIRHPANSIAAVLLCPLGFLAEMLDLTWLKAAVPLVHARRNEEEEEVGNGDEEEGLYEAAYASAAEMGAGRLCQGPILCSQVAGCSLEHRVVFREPAAYAGASQEVIVATGSRTSMPRAPPARRTAARAAPDKATDSSNVLGKVLRQQGASGNITNLGKALRQQGVGKNTCLLRQTLRDQGAAGNKGIAVMRQGIRGNTASAQTCSSSWKPYVKSAPRKSKA